jgi:hypothetical protein
MSFVNKARMPAGGCPEALGSLFNNVSTFLFLTMDAIERIREKILDIRLVLYLTITVCQMASRVEANLELDHEYPLNRKRKKEVNSLK